MARRLPVRRRSVLQRGLLGPAPVLRAMRCPQLLVIASALQSPLLLIHASAVVALWLTADLALVASVANQPNSFFKSNKSTKLW
jgi:hypothetical protein